MRGFFCFWLALVGCQVSKLTCTFIQVQPGGLSVGNVTSDQDDQVIDQRGSSRMGDLQKVLAELLEYIGPDVCDSFVAERHQDCA